ncbi:hypothetical protein, partial [Deinococcus saxicola]|uniref:hypothetical protein n=1 Tax=Deinococcus saxicola TaxID=249406 RepID=UPI0039EECC26
IGGKPHRGLRDRTLRHLNTAQEIHDPPDPADRQTYLVMQGLKGGVQDRSEPMGSRAHLISLQGRMVTTHRVMTLGAGHHRHVVLSDSHGVLRGEFRDPGLVVTCEDQRSRKST